ncbi:MAG: DUF896 domain-containing protein [Syntrophomonas sp.]|nr:DUF896 domain-containing protein [Syntrophomonas sp.]
MQEESLLRINELSRKKKTEGLTAEEQAEQAELYRVFIDDIKNQVKTALDNEIEICKSEE